MDFSDIPVLGQFFLAKSKLGTGVLAALMKAIGVAGSPVLNGGALGTPSSGNLSNCTAATATTAGIVPGLGTVVSAGTNALTVADSMLVPIMRMGWERVLPATTGSGTYEGNGGVYYGCGTGTTAGSTSRVDSNSSAGDPWYLGGFRSASTIDPADSFVINGIFLRLSNTTNGIWRVGIGKTHGGAVGQWTEAGVGFVCKNLRLWSFTHNGSTYTETNTGVDIPGGELPMQFCIRRTSTAFEFYLNRVLVATHTVAGYTMGRFIRIEAENGADAAAQRMRISPLTFRFL